jgi:hypothetical protein
VGILTFAVYAFTLHPSVPGGDSGELIVAARVLGVAHPPGYPLHTMLGHLFSRIPFGTVAARINLLSAVCDALAAAIIVLIVIRWSNNIWAGFLAGGSFAFASGIWTYALVAEVFALNNLLVTLLLYASVRFNEHHSLRWAVLASLVMGLGIANQHTLFLYALPLAIWALVTARKTLFTRRGLSLVLLGSVLGLLPLLYLPIAARQHPPLHWGNLSTWKGFMDHLLRRHVGTFNLAFPGTEAPSPIIEHFHAFMRNLVKQTTVAGLVLAGVGACVAAMEPRVRSLNVCWHLAFQFYLVFVHAGANLPLNDPHALGVEQRFWQQTSVLVFVWLGVGFAAVVGRKKALAAGVAMLLVLGQLVRNFAFEDQRDNRYVEAYGREILRPLPPGAILVLNGDLEVNAVSYLQLCEGVRTDVVSLCSASMTWPWYKPQLEHRYPWLKLPGFAMSAKVRGCYSFADFVNANGSRPIYSAIGLPENETAIASQFALWPSGLSLRIMQADRSVAFDEWLPKSQERLPRVALPPLWKYPTTHWEFNVAENCWMAHRARAETILLHATRRRDPALVEEVIRLLEKVDAAQIPPHPDTKLVLAAAYARREPRTAESVARRKTLLSQLVEMLPPHDPRAEEAARALQRDQR